MSRYINPLLIDRTAYAVSMVGNYTSQRPSAAETSAGPTFAEHLQTVQSSHIAQATEEAAPAQQVADASSSTSTARVDRSMAENVDEVQDFTFEDLVDIINPLQHIPILGTVYREMTGDTIKPAARIAGDVAFGALTGSLVVSAAISIASAAFEASEGEEPLVKVADALFGMDDLPETNDTEERIMLASAETDEDVSAEDKNAETSETDNVKLASAKEAGTNAAAMVPAKVETVEVASADTSMLTTTDAMSKGKQPFGGIMDPALLGGAQPASATTVASATTATPKKKAPQIRIGNTLYTSPLMDQAARLNATHAAKLAAAQKAASKETALSTEATAAEAKSEMPSLAASLMQSAPSTAALSPPALMSVPGTEADESKKLGQLMHQSSAAASSGNTLPPELVHDMMLMALDKYKTANGLAPSEMTVDVMN